MGEITTIETIVAKVVHHNLECRKIRNLLFLGEIPCGKKQGGFRTRVLFETVTEMSYRTDSHYDIGTGIHLPDNGNDSCQRFFTLFYVYSFTQVKMFGKFMAVSHYLSGLCPAIDVCRAKRDDDSLSLRNILLKRFKGLVYLLA